MHVLFAICLVACASLPAAASAADQQASPRLNVVLIVADDLGWGEVGCYGQQKIPTPNIDRLAADGIRLTQFYSGAPVCAPARCVLMTGRHLGHAEIRGNRQAAVSFPQFTEGQHPISAAVKTFPQVFREAGYATGAMGKWGLGPVGSTGDPNAKGFDLFFGYNCQAVAHSFYPATLWRNAKQIPLNERPIPGHKKQPNGEVRAEDYRGTAYASTAIVAEAERFIAEHASEPFLLYLPFIEPHVAMHPPQASVDRFPEAWDSEPYRGQNGYLPHPRPRAGYAAMIADLDDHVGRVVAGLEQAGVSDRTLVVFTSDNGPTHPGRDPKFHIGGADPEFFNSTRGLKGYKGSVYEGGIRVPLIARLPGQIAAGSQSDVPGTFADIFPTLCAAAGLPIPVGLDGESLWPMLTGTGPSPEADRPLVWVFPESGGQVAVRMGPMKCLRQNLNRQQPGAWEVYDMAADPGETKNLAADSPDLIAAAEAILAREMNENLIFPVDLPRPPE
jgi:arylsulfatase A